MEVPADLLAPVVEQTATDTGRVGESLVAYYLERSGIRCSLVDRRGADIWCERPDGSLFRLEVKTAAQPCNHARGVESYSYQVRTRRAEWYAFVALDLQLVIFQPRGWLRPYQTHRIAPEEFTEAGMVEGLDRLLVSPKTTKAA